MAEYTVGRFVWRELMTTDIDAAKRTYGELFGWKLDTVDMGGMDYTLIKLGDRMIGGMMQIPGEHAGKIPPHWASYVSVDSVDAAVERAKAAGGQIPMGPTDIPGTGRFATILDPQGGVTNAFRALTGDPPVARPGQGDFCWESLQAKDLDALLPFYTSVYGWKSATNHGMSTLGVGEGEQNQVASVMGAPPGAPTHWLTYVVVDKIGPARDRLTRLGGKILVEAITVPNVGTFAIGQDAQGATICPFESAMG